MNKGRLHTLWYRCPERGLLHIRGAYTPTAWRPVEPGACQACKGKHTYFYSVNPDSNLRIRAADQVRPIPGEPPCRAV